MLQNQKVKKGKPLELGPISLTKTNYKPYMNGLPNRRGKQNLTTMGPVENIIFDIPKIEEASETIQLTSIEKLRLKVSKLFEQRCLKAKDQWDLYMKKASIIDSSIATNSWKEIEIFLLNIILDLFKKWKAQLARKDNVMENQGSFTKGEITKLSQRSERQLVFNSLCGLQSIDNSFNKNSYTNLPRGNLACTKVSKKHSPCKNGSDLDQASTVCIDASKAQASSPQFIITKLQRELEIYKQKISKMQAQNNQKISEMQRKIDLQTSIKHNGSIQQRMKYQIQVENKKFYNEVLLQELKVLNKKNKVLMIQMQQIKKDTTVTKQDIAAEEKINQYREMWLMQYEEIRQLNLEVNRVVNEKEIQIGKTKMLKQKLKELSKSFNYNYNVSIDSEKESQDLNKILKDFRDWLTFFAVPRVSKGMMNNNTFFPEMYLTIESSKDDYTDLLPKDDTTNYKLLRPNFFIFFESYESMIMTQKKFPQRKILPPIFYLTIRAIFDAMYLQFTFTSDFNQWLSFPEFVISFIEKFEVNLETNKPMLRKMPCQSEDKVGFLLNIFNLEAVNTWERQMFRSFVLEDFTLDEVYFYLDCRDNLLKGSQLNNNFGSFDTITYIRVNIAEEVIKDKLKNYDKEMLDRLNKFINSKKKVKNNKELVDMNFVLKLLLEVYSIEKLKSQRFFYNNFKCKSTGFTKISYTQYSAFMSKNFEYLTKGEIAKLYRQIYTVGVSNVTYKTIHYICSTKGLFIPLLRNKYVSNFNVFDHAKYSKPFEDLLFLHLQNSLNNLVVGVDQFGLENIVEIKTSFNKLLHDCEGHRLQRSVFMNKLLDQVEKILKVRSIIGWKNNKSLIHTQLTKQEVREKLGYVLTIINQSDDDLTMRKKWKQVRQRAIKKLTKNFKIRIQESLAEFKVMDKRQYEKKIGEGMNNNRRLSSFHPDNQQ